MSRAFPFRNLVFHGGGVRTFAYHGVLPVLEEAGILERIERVAGSSAGALAAAWLSFGLNAAETIDLYRSLDYSKIPESKPEFKGRLSPPQPIEEGLERIAGRLLALSRIVKRYGMHPTTYPVSWMTETIASQCGGDGRATFADFRHRGFRDLSVVTTNVSTHTVAVFSADTTPNAAVVDALLLSQSIPLFFEAPRFDGQKLGHGDYYGDGGMLNNYPLHIYDDPRYANGSPWFAGGVNWETLGCHLFTPEDSTRRHRRRPISSVAAYISNLIEILIESGDAAYRNNPTARQRSVDISNCGVSIADFNIELTPEDERYAKLIRAGERATRRYLESYRSPVDRD